MPGHKYEIEAYRGARPFAFVSYAHEDSAEVFSELETLSAAGVRLYYDEGIHPGHAWHEELAEAIQKCAVFVLFVTARSVSRRNCQRELAFALEHDKPVLAVHLEDTDLPPGVRLAIGDRQAIIRSRFSESRFHERLIQAIGEYVDVEVDAAPERASEARPSETQAIAGADRAKPPRVVGRRRTWFVVGAAVVMLASSVAYVVWRDARLSRDTREAAFVRVEQLIRQDQYGPAFAMAHQYSDTKDLRWEALWKQLVVPGMPLVTESGATLSFKPYDAPPDSDWIVAGTTPIEAPIDLPKGVVRLRLEKPGFQTAEFAVANPGLSFKSPITEQARARLGTFGTAEEMPLPLARVGELPDDMVFVPATNEPVFLNGWTVGLLGSDQHEMPAFGIDRYEVSNRQYKEFVDAGGYDDRAYWDGLVFRDDGHTLSWDEARARFVDRTGRPGPAEWQLSSYAQGQGDMPVGGISWYEAVAYARFRQLSLPTIHHWLRAAFGPYEGVFLTAPEVAGSSRFLADGPIEARNDKGLGPWGTYNTAGNVREWVWNFVGDEGVTLGGAWRDYAGTYQVMRTARPMDRTAETGLRLMKSFDAVSTDLLGPITIPIDEAFAKRAPVSDDAFEAMRFQFVAGARTPIDVNVERIAESDAWTADEVVLAFGPDDSFSVFVVLPRAHRGALQPVLYGPPGNAFVLRRPNREVLEQLASAGMIVNGGRALVIPIWHGTYQRVLPPSSDAAVLTDRSRKAPVEWYQDAATTIGYLATRGDMDMTHIGYVGFSTGAMALGPPLLALDYRIKAAVLIGAGILTSNESLKTEGYLNHPMIDSVNYVPRIHCPVLMVNGRYDNIVPYESSQLRMYELLGTPTADKRQVVYDVGHFSYPPNLLAKEVTDWFDKYLGPVN